MVTLFDVARLAGVSTATVSRVVHGQDRVRDATRTRVLRAIEELGYVPDGAAQSLSRGRKDVIGLVCKEREVDYALENAGLLYYDQVLRGVEEHDPLPRLVAADHLHAVRWDGRAGCPPAGRVLGQGGRHPHRRRVHRAPVIIKRLAARVPVVIIAGTPGERAADVVAADNFSGSAAIVTHLIADHGNERLFHVDGPLDAPDAIERRLGLHHVLRDNPQCQLIGSEHGIFSARSGEQAGENLLARHRGALPDAVVCANDQMAIGVLRAFAAAGVRVPDEVAVVGFDDIYPASLFDPPLTPVLQPIRMLGERACARLLDRIAVPDLTPPCSCCRPSSSCGPAAAARPARKSASRSCRWRPPGHARSHRTDGRRIRQPAQAPGRPAAAKA